MKASLKVRDDHQNPLFRAKVPITVLGLPFISSVTAGDSSDLSFHLRTASATGPSLKLSYSPNHHHNPFSFSVQSGVGVWGSPHRSPLLMSAHFSLLGTLNPSFYLQITPQFGDFSLKKAFRSLPNPNPNPIKENGGVHLDPPMDWTEIHHAGRGFFSGTALTARTLLPVTKHVAVKFRWGVNFPAEFGRKNLPFLTVDKIGIERVLPSDESCGVSTLKSSGDARELEVLKGLCFWMGREVEGLQRENRSMKESLEEIRSGIQANSRREVGIPGKRAPEIKGDSGEFERWRKKKQNEGGDDGRRDTKPGGLSGAAGNDVEEELKRAIKAASS